MEKEILQNLIKAAITSRNHSHSPHSKFRVGSALLTSKNNIYNGTNVEFDAYSLTICAERAALFNAVSNGEKEIIHIAVSTDTEDFKYPCGLCRQALIEFNPNLELTMINKFEMTKTININTLLPNYFKLGS